MWPLQPAAVGSRSPLNARPGRAPRQSRLRVKENAGPKDGTARKCRIGQSVTLARAGQWDSELGAGSKKRGAGDVPTTPAAYSAVRRGAAFASW